MKYREPTADQQTAADPQPAAYTSQAPTDPQRTDVTVEPTPDDQIKTGDSLHRRVQAATVHGAATWLGIYRQPPSIRDAWELSSAIDSRRIPGDSGRLNGLWWALNRSERVALFAVIVVLLAPVATLLYCACRPARRAGLYIVIAALILVPAIAGG
jgi:hypothetical protein